MSTREQILDNVNQYTAEDLFKYIRLGVVTFDELVHESYDPFNASTRRKLRQLIENGDNDEYQRAIDTNTIEAYKNYLDMYPQGEHAEEAQAKIRQLEREETERIARHDFEQNFEDEIAEAEEAWQCIDKHDQEMLSTFIQAYPHSPHYDEAIMYLLNDVDINTLVSRIKSIQTDKTMTPDQKISNMANEVKSFIDDEKISKRDFLERLAVDKNLLPSGSVKLLIENGVISIPDLLGIGIDRVFINKVLHAEPLNSLPMPDDIAEIHKQCTEIYFWGIPSSGKSCALGAILSVAAGGEVAFNLDPDTDSQGYGYMTQLINIFRPNQICNLLMGTPLEAFYEMGFDLVDKKNKVHPITCIDMAGELMRAMYKYNARMELEERDIHMLDVLTKMLVSNRSVNPKMHFFVLEYGAEDRLYEGLPQKVYLEGAVSYIKNTGIFKKDTNAIYLLISKADKAPELTREFFNDYINETYRGFYNGLQDICRNNEINGGVINKIPFSLGDVCFQNYCLFNPKPAENVVSLILDSTPSVKKGLFGKFGGILRD